MNDNPDNKPKEDLTGRQTYNVVSDTVTGVNIRAKDNLFQAIAIGAFGLLGAIVGLFIADSKVVGAVAGGFVGVVVGLFASGIFLMIYRAVKHTKGEHD